MLAAVSVDMVDDEDVDSVDPDTPLISDCAFTLSHPTGDGDYVARVRAKDVAATTPTAESILSQPHPPHGAGSYVTSPTAATTTNLSTFTWTWMVEDDEDGPEFGVTG